jgi:heptosyltransferase-2
MVQHRLENQRFALFMPGCQAAGWLKRWGWRRFSALAVELSRRGIDKVVLVGAEDERDECDAIAAACPDITVNLCAETEVLDLVPLARGARCVVANDTGTAHVAAVADRPMVVVCGPTDPRRVRPAGLRVHTRQSDLWCVNCYRKDCVHHACMEVLHPGLVLESLEVAGAFVEGAR